MEMRRCVGGLERKAVVRAALALAASLALSGPLIMAAVCGVPAAAAQGSGGAVESEATRGGAALKPEDAKPYDDKLNRLSEILGAVHYLRELCGQNDGQLWRDEMREILTADSASALRRAMLTRSFNNGYRSYGRTYQACTPSAQTAIGRYLAEGSQLADTLVKTVP
ncbi:MAG: TIGR02301 family protein [Hyphomicrobiaceae bacterium]